VVDEDDRAALPGISRTSFIITIYLSAYNQVRSKEEDRLASFPQGEGQNRI